MAPYYELASLPYFTEYKKWFAVGHDLARIPVTAKDVAEVYWARRGHEMPENEFVLNGCGCSSCDQYIEEVRFLRWLRLIKLPAVLAKRAVSEAVRMTSTARKEAETFVRSALPLEIKSADHSISMSGYFVMPRTTFNRGDTLAVVMSGKVMRLVKEPESKFRWQLPDIPDPDDE